MIAENFRVVLTKYIRIAADVFMNLVFKGNTVTDRGSAPYRTSISRQFTVCRKPKCARVGTEPKYCITLSRFFAAQVHMLSP